MKWWKRVLRKILIKGIRVKEVKTPQEKELFHKLWRKVWRQEGYSNPEDEERIVNHYHLYEPYSTDLIFFLWFFIPVGTLRIIWPSEIGTPVINDFELWQKTAGALPEITLLTLKPKVRKWGISIFMFREAYRIVKRKGYTGVLMAADERLFRLLRELFPTIKQVGTGKWYEGSFTIPAVIQFEETIQCLKETNPRLLEFFEVLEEP